MTDQNSEVVQQLLRLDEKRCEVQNAGDVQGCAQLLSDDLIHIHANGRTETKDAFLEKNVAKETRPTRSRGPRVVRVFGDFAIMTGPQYFKTPERRGELMVTQVWRREEGGWKQLSFHACWCTEER